ncbi:MAG TPA: methylamine utilization protein [Caulobacteraceae bacterium]|jgi:plastocyanin|nr:methylamine utilization protein [Caulobacteraceae bacterium]
MRSLFGVLALLTLASPACAGDLYVTVTNAKGAPVEDAAVLVWSAGARTPGQYDAPLRVVQKDKQFHPFVLIVPLGADVTFPNEDPFRHQVYSFSKAKTFELKLYGGGQVPRVTFDKLGSVALGCNIHDGMIGFIKVTDATAGARTDASGRAVLHGLPAGEATLKIWRPYLSAPNNEVAMQVRIPAAGHLDEAFKIKLGPPPLRTTEEY